MEDSKRAAGRRRKSKGKEIEALNTEEGLERFRLSGGDGNKAADEEVDNTSG